MARDPVTATSAFSSALRTFSRPWPIMLAGLACTVAGLVLSQTSLVPLRLMFLGAGILLAGGAVARRLQTASWDLLEERAESAGLLAFSAFVALLAFFNMEESWDSGRMFLGVCITLALVGSFLVLLPRPGRRIAAIVLVLLHFGGILTAVTSVAPPQGAPPWISMQLWTNLYRYYLFFGYFTNAYHFYSPDPGPATLLWFHVEHEDGSARWIKLPNRHESLVGLHHQRMLAAAESTVMPANFSLPSKEEVDAFQQRFKCPYIILPGIPHELWPDIMKRRSLAPQLCKFQDPKDGRPAPLYIVAQLQPGDPPQYSEPMESARRLISSFARHVAHSFPDPKDPSNGVKAVRVYRVVHRILTPRELSEGKDPLDDTTCLPYYMGKYDPEGNLLDGGKYDRDGRMIQTADPYLFFYMPIIRVPKRYPEPGTFIPGPDGPMLNPHWEAKGGEEEKIIDFVEIHATQSDKFRQEISEK